MKPSVKEIIPNLHPLVERVYSLFLRFFELKGGFVSALEISERRGELKHAILGVSQSGNRWNVVSD